MDPVGCDPRPAPIIYMSFVYMSVDAGIFLVFVRSSATSHDLLQNLREFTATCGVPQHVAWVNGQVPSSVPNLNHSTTQLQLAITILQP